MAFIEIYAIKCLSEHGISEVQSVSCEDVVRLKRVILV